KLGSTLIRRYLNEGKIEDVTALLGRFTKSKDKSSQEAKSVANSTSRPQTSPSGRILRRYGREFMLPSSSLTAINISGYAISVTIRPLIPKKNDAWKSICLVLTGIYMPKRLRSALSNGCGTKWFLIIYRNSINKSKPIFGRPNSL
ncbi:MAG TPA: hypothetical protein PLK86_05680, partial [Bacilli bacterium]|nr:hypothetical protein [Bacilli bacterium]